MYSQYPKVLLGCLVVASLFIAFRFTGHTPEISLDSQPNNPTYELSVPREVTENKNQKDRHLPRIEHGMVEPMFIADPESYFSDEQIAAYNASHVEPFNKPLGYDCQSINDGEFVSICSTIYERPPHLYQTLSTQELAELSYNDPVAALYLALRITPSGVKEVELQDTRLAQRDLFVRSTALSGKTGPLIKFSEWMLNDGVLMTPTKNGVEKSYDLESLAMKIAVLNIAAEMGDRRAKPIEARKEFLRIIREELPEENAAQWLEKIDNTTVSIREQITQIKTVVGI